MTSTSFLIRAVIWVEALMKCSSLENIKGAAYCQDKLDSMDLCSDAELSNIYSGGLTSFPVQPFRSWRGQKTKGKYHCSIEDRGECDASLQGELAGGKHNHLP